jgi:uncharacterized membrane protein YdjX (TVP38/TMEM64 family)
LTGTRVRGLRGPLLRFAVMVAILVAAFFLFRGSLLAEYLDADRLSRTVDQLRTAWWAPLALIGLWTVMSPLGLPATPLVVAGGVVFGAGLGTLYNCVGACLGAAATYFFARRLGYDLVAHLLGEERFGRVERRLETYGFRALVGIRFLPLPWPLVNFGAALAGFRFAPFMLATAIGVVPVLFIYTFFFSSLADATIEEGRTKLLQLVGALALLVALVAARWLLRRRSAALDGDPERMPVDRGASTERRDSAS